MTNPRGRPPKTRARPTSENANTFTKLAKQIAKHNHSTILEEKYRKKKLQAGHAAEWQKFSKYYNDMEGYAYDHFGIRFSPQQKEIATALLRDKRVCVRAAHSLGKSYLLGVALNFFYDTRYPLVGIGSAPTHQLLREVLFGYARQFRSEDRTGNLKNHWRGSSNPLIKSSDNHFFTGLVTTDPTAMQGRHGENVVILLDEAVGISQEIFESIDSLMIGDDVYALCIYNPTDPSSYVSTLEKQDGWVTITMSAYDHPNIWVGVERLQQNRPVTDDLPYPGAINLDWFERKLKQWSTRVNKNEYKPGQDIILPSSLLLPETEYYRPGPIASSRLLGRWPEISMNNIFAEYEIENAITRFMAAKPFDRLSIGVDVARFGSDFSAFCVRRGGNILYLEEYNGLSTTEVTKYTIELAQKYSEIYQVSAQSIDIAVDSIGLGAGVCDQLADYGYNVHEVNTSNRAWNPDEYVNVRSELWCELHNIFLDGAISLRHLDVSITHRLKKHLLSPQYTYDNRGRRKVESKDSIRKRLQRSTDLADSVMLAYAVNSEFSSGLTVDTDD